MDCNEILEFPTSGEKFNGQVPYCYQAPSFAIIPQRDITYRVTPAIAPEGSDDYTIYETLVNPSAVFVPFGYKMIVKIDFEPKTEHKLRVLRF